MGLLSRILGKGNERSQAASSKGISTIIEVCSRNDLLDDSLLHRGIAELQQEGPLGSAALTELIRELLASRTAKIRTALWAAGKLKGTPDLIASLREVLRSDTVVSQTATGRFAAEIAGEGRIGWTDGTHAQIRKLATEALVSLGESPQRSDRTDTDVSPNRESWSQQQNELAVVVRKFAAREAHSTDVGQQASSMSPADIANVLTVLLTGDPNGQLGLAAVQSAVLFCKLPSEYGMTIVSAGIDSTNSSVRNVSISYLEEHPNTAAKGMAAGRIPSEERTDFRSRLQAVVDSNG